MNKTLIRIALVALVAVMAVTVVACGKKGDSATTYKVDEVKQKLISLLDVDESELRIDETSRGTTLSYGDWETWFDCYILEDLKVAPDIFDLQTLAGTFDDKRIDKKDHKLWVETNDGSSDLHTVLAMKDNLILSITSEVTPEKLVETFNLD